MQSKMKNHGQPSKAKLKCALRMNALAESVKHDSVK